MWRLLLLGFMAVAAQTEDTSETDGESSRKILGSSVVTSVSVIMDTGNGSKVYTDAVGKPVAKPLTASDLASPIDLLNPDRYEFYTFDDSGDLVKRLMTLEEIQEIIATGDGDGFTLDSFTSNGFLPEKRVNDVVNNVQNVLKEEMKVHKYPEKPLFDTPDVSDSWSMILPAVFGNSGEDIKPEKPITHVTPDTIMIEPTASTERPKTATNAPVTTRATTNAPVTTRATTNAPVTTRATTNAPVTTRATTPQVTTYKPKLNVTSTKEQLSTTQKIQSLATEPKPLATTTEESLPSKINVEVSFNSKSTTPKPNSISTADFKPLELGKDNRPVYLVTKKRPIKPMTTEDQIAAATSAGTTPIFLFSSTPNSDNKITVVKLTTPAQLSSLALKSTTPQIFETTTTKLSTSQTVPQRVSTPDKLATTQTVLQRVSTPDKLATTQTVPQQASTAETSPVTQTSDNPSLSTIDQTSAATTKITSKPIRTSTFNTVNSEEVTSLFSNRPEISTILLLSTPQETTTAQAVVRSTTTELASTTQLELTTPAATTKPPQDSSEDSLPTLLEILHSYQSFRPQNQAIVSTTETPETTTIPPTSTFGSLSTFFMINDNKFSKVETTSENFLPTTTNNDQITTDSDKIITRVTTDGDDLSTLSSEYVTPNKTQQVGLERPSTSTVLPSSEFLEQFLLTSTNIYEINSELGERKVFTTTGPEISTVIPNTAFTVSTNDVDPTATTNVDYTERIETSRPVVTNPTTPSATNPTVVSNTFTNDIDTTNPTVFAKTDASTEPTDATTNPVSTTQEDKTTPTLWIRLRDSTTTTEIPTTTDQSYSNIISSLEQLLSQAVGSTIEPPIINEKDVLKIEEMMKNSGNKSMPQIRIEAATVASNLLDFTSTEVATPETSTLDSELSTTEEPSTSTKEIPHIINITIIRNDKPAKSDLSLEQDFETKKNASEVLNTEETRFDEISTTEYSSESTTISTTAEELFSTTIQTPNVVVTINENAGIDNNTDNAWTLVSTLSPDTETKPSENKPTEINTVLEPPAPVDLVPKPMQGFGLEDSTLRLDADIYHFAQLCNELAFGFWKSVNSGVSSARSIVISPFAATSILAMVFLGARGATSGEMNEILKLDDMVTFNPHLIFKNVSESIEVSAESGVAVSAIVRELFSDRSKGKLLGFYKERVRQFYDGHVEEASFKEIGDVIRRRTNLLVKKHTGGKVSEFLKDSSIYAKPPLAGISVSIFQSDCGQASTQGRDGELHFVVLPTIRQRRLIPIPAAVWRSGFLAGYEPSLDATAAALGSKDQIISTIFVIPGQQGIAAPGDGLARLEKALVESSFKKGAWSRLLRSLIPRPGLELQIPRFSHRSLVNATASLKTMGLKDLFDSHKADLRGLNGNAHELHLSDVLQINEFATCGESRIGDTHHKEFYPATAARRARYLDLEEPRDYQRSFHDPLHDPSYLSLPLPLRPRQARLPEAPRLRFDRPFLYFVRHNPSGLILHMGRFHPRLLP